MSLPELTLWQHINSPVGHCVSFGWADTMDNVLLLQCSVDCFVVIVFIITTIECAAAGGSYCMVWFILLFPSWTNMLVVLVVMPVL